MTADPSRETDRPSSREVADLLSEYRQMITDAGGLAQRIPPDRAADWQARKAQAARQDRGVDEIARITS